MGAKGVSKNETDHFLGCIDFSLVAQGLPASTFQKMRPLGATPAYQVRRLFTYKRHTYTPGDGLTN